MTTEKNQEINVEYIGGGFSSRSIHELACGLAYYNYQGNHFRVFKSFEDAKAFIDGEPVAVLIECDSEEDLDQFLEDTEICSVCGAICTADDECYSDADTSDACCARCCFYDEGDDVYRKGSEAEYGLKLFYEEDVCPHCKTSDYSIISECDDGEHSFKEYQCDECSKKWTSRYRLDKISVPELTPTLEVKYLIPSEDEEMQERENKAMGDFLEKQLGFSQESVSDIANGSTTLYCVHVVCDNELKHYSLHTKEEDAQAAFILKSKEWYNDDGLADFASNVEYDTEVEHYDGYFDSPEYNDACDSAKVTWEVLNA